MTKNEDNQDDRYLINRCTNFKAQPSGKKVFGVSIMCLECFFRKLFPRHSLGFIALSETLHVFVRGQKIGRIPSLGGLLCASAKLYQNHYSLVAPVAVITWPIQRWPASN